MARVGNRVPVCVLALALLAALPPPSSAQQAAVAPHVGTLGLGADLAVTVAPRVALRVSANFFPFDVSAEEEGVDYTLDLPSPRFLLTADYYPVGELRLSGGVLIAPTDVGLRGTPSEPVEIGTTEYTPQQVGTVTATVATRRVSPYLGLGFGHPGRSRVGFFVEAGVAFHGNPELSAEVDGPVASLPGFRQDLATEVAERQDDIRNVVVYPILSLGLSIRLAAGGELAHRDR